MISVKVLAESRCDRADEILAMNLDVRGERPTGFGIPADMATDRTFRHDRLLPWMIKAILMVLYF